MSDKMQYLVSLPDETIEKVVQLEKWWRTDRDRITEQAINSLYQREVDHQRRFSTVEDVEKKPPAEVKTVYRIFEGRSGNQLTAKNILQEEVRISLSAGWTLYGSPFCVVGIGDFIGGTWTYSQAMIKEE